MPVLTLTREQRELFDDLARDLRAIFGDRFVALAAYEPRRAVAFARSITVGDLAAAARRAPEWMLDLEVPLLLTPEEFRRSLDTFPIEYGQILRCHVVIDGTPPFEGVSVTEIDARRELELLAKGHVLHLRAGAMATGGSASKGAQLIRASVDPFRALLTNLARLNGSDPDSDAEVAAAAAGALELAPDTLEGILAIDGAESFDPSAVMPPYLDAAERLWKALDRWRER